MKQGTGSGFNTKLYTILLHRIPPRKAQKTLVMVVLFMAVYDAAIVYNFVLKPDPVPCFMTFSASLGHTYPLKHFMFFLISSSYSFWLKDFVVLFPLCRS